MRAPPQWSALRIVTMATVAAVQNLPRYEQALRAVAICYCDESESHRTTDVSTKSTDYALLVDSLQSLSCGAIRHKSRRVSPRLTRKAPPQICLARQSTCYIDSTWHAPCSTTSAESTEASRKAMRILSRFFQRAQGGAITAIFTELKPQCRKVRTPCPRRRAALTFCTRKQNG